MGRLLSVILVLAVLAIAGCGGGEGSGSALGSALSVLPKDASVAVAIDTNVDGDQYKALNKLLEKFPFSGQIKSSLLQQLEQSAGGVNFNDDIKPVLGNPIVVGATTATSNDVVAAMKAKDKGKLDDLVSKAKAQKIGEASGATLYKDGDSVFAVKDDLIVFANDEAQLKSALARADGDDHLDEQTFNDSLSGLPDPALARVYVDVEALLKRDPSARDARRVKWIAALRQVGATVTAKDNALDIDFRARTEGDLSEEDLPIASGDKAPPVIKRRGEVGLGIRDLAHIVHFAENAGQSIDPSGFGDYERAKKTIDKQLGVSLDDDLIAQLTGNVSATVALDGGFGVRAELKDPQAFEKTLARVADVLPSFAKGAGFGTVGLSKPKAGQKFYALAQPDGDAVIFGVVNGVLVVANDAKRAAAVAAAEPVDVPGASGSVTLSADAEQLVNRILIQYGPTLGLGDLGSLGVGMFARPLGDLDGWMSASPDELRGKLTLAVE
ncbi:MAG: DUF3352 domain-containing protein [Thermoleophilaceae bacterium]